MVNVSNALERSIKIPRIYFPWLKASVGLYLVTRVLFLFYKIGVTQTIFNLSGKTPFAKEILKICFKMTNISSDTLLTNSADIWSYPELLFDLRLANLFSRFKSGRLLVLRQGTSQWIYFSNQVLLSGMEAAKLGPILTK